MSDCQWCGYRGQSDCTCSPTWNQMAAIGNVGHREPEPRRAAPEHQLPLPRGPLMGTKDKRATCPRCGNQRPAPGVCPTCDGDRAPLLERLERASQGDDTHSRIHDLLREAMVVISFLSAQDREPLETALVHPDYLRHLMKIEDRAIKAGWAESTDWERPK